MSIKEKNKRRFKEIEKIRNGLTKKVSPEDKEIIEKGVEKAWEEHKETFRALSEVDEQT